MFLLKGLLAVILIVLNCVPYSLQHFWQGSNQLKSKWEPSVRDDSPKYQNQMPIFEGQAPIQIAQVPFMHPIDPIAPVLLMPQEPIKLVAPFPIQQPVLSHTGEVIIENTLGGVSFDCRFKASGHWRDEKFCDVNSFHKFIFLTNCF